MATPQEIIASLCRKYGTQLRLPAGVGERVLWAIAGCESEFGAYPLPKHEDGYCSGHRYDVPALTRRWGCAAHCSYGPWQVMFAHLVDLLPPQMRDPSLLIFPAGETGLKFAVAADYLCAATVEFINAEILGRQKATTLDQISKAYNHGNWADSFDDSDYQRQALKFYNTPMPQEAPNAPSAI